MQMWHSWTIWIQFATAQTLFLYYKELTSYSTACGEQLKSIREGCDKVSAYRNKELDYGVQFKQRVEDGTEELLQLKLKF